MRIENQTQLVTHAFLTCTDLAADHRGQQPLQSASHIFPVPLSHIWRTTTSEIQLNG